MRKIILLICVGLFLSGCTFFRPHKIDIEQGNIITERNVNKLHRGMTEAEVKKIMGIPQLTNLFTPNRIDYVYTFQVGGQNMYITRVICIFRNGILQQIITHK